MKSLQQFRKRFKKKAEQQLPSNEQRKKSLLLEQVPQKLSQKQQALEPKQVEDQQKHQNTLDIEHQPQLETAKVKPNQQSQKSLPFSQHDLDNQIQKHLQPGQKDEEILQQRKPAIQNLQLQNNPSPSRIVVGGEIQSKGPAKIYDGDREQPRQPKANIIQPRASDTEREQVLHQNIEKQPEPEQIHVVKPSQKHESNTEFETNKTNDHQTQINPTGSIESGKDIQKIAAQPKNREKHEQNASTMLNKPKKLQQAPKKLNKIEQLRQKMRLKKLQEDNKNKKTSSVQDNQLQKNQFREIKVDAIKPMEKPNQQIQQMQAQNNRNTSNLSEPPSQPIRDIFIQKLASEDKQNQEDRRTPMQEGVIQNQQETQQEKNIQLQVQEGVSEQKEGQDDQALNEPQRNIRKQNPVGANAQNIDKKLTNLYSKPLYGQIQDLKLYLKSLQIKKHVQDKKMVQEEYCSSGKPSKQNILLKELRKFKELSKLCGL